MSPFKVRGRSSIIVGLVISAVLGMTFLARHVVAGPGSPSSPQSSGWVWNSYDFGNQISMVSADDGWMVMRGAHVNSLDDHSVYVFHWDGEKWSSAGNLSHTSRIFSVDIDMVSSTDGWIVAGGGGTDSTIFRWNGSVWVKFDELSDVSLKAIDMLSPNEGWTFGASGSGSAFYYWNGSTWESEVAQSSMVSVDGDLDMVSGSDGWAVGNDGIVRWTGVEWVDVPIPVSRTFRSISMLDQNNGWIVGGGYYEPGVILRWNGTEWVEVNSPVDTGLLAIDMVSSNDGWAVGLNGVILHWDGIVFTQIPHPNSPEDRPIYSIDMLSSTDGWFSGLAGGTFRYVVRPELVINFSNGAPGSLFTISGIDYPPNDEATIEINDREMGSVPTDDNGAFTLILSTAEADEGIYIVTVSVNPSATTGFVLQSDAPLRPKEGEGTEIAVPAGIALMEQLFLPTISR